VSVDCLMMLDKYFNVPHAVIGNRWMGTTHTVMAWLTRLVEDEVRCQYYEGRNKEIYADYENEPEDPDDVYPPPKKPHVRGLSTYLRLRRERRKPKPDATDDIEMPKVKPKGSPKRRAK